MPWITTSFPSKFVEFSHTGLPTLIVAPQRSAIGLWAASRGYPDYFPAERLDAVRAFVVDLKNEAAWNKKAALVTHFARTEFNPDEIQAALESRLTANQPTSNPPSL